MKRLWLLLALAGCQAEVPAPDYDILIVGGTVYDGSLRPGAERNIGITDGRIASVDARADASARTTVDASGKLVMPGFIDPHTHAVSTLRDPERKANLNYLMQGVTTVFIGSDGGGVSAPEETIALFEEQGIGTNVALLAGHGAIRETVMGLADRPATESELAEMKRRLADEMQRGAFGLSSGLFYAPGSYAATEELIELARVAAELGGIYDTHMRSESSYGDGLLAAVDETIRIAREAGIAVHISHIKALGKDMWGQSTAIIERVEAARDEGLDVTANQYPWRASGTRFSNALIPRWVMADSKQQMVERLRDPDLLPSILDEMQDNLELRGGPDAMLVSAADSAYRGQTLTEIAASMQTDLLAAAIEVVIGGDPSIASFVMDPADINALAVQSWVMTGSDGSSGHPRLYATYPKAWQDLVDTGMLSEEAFVHRSSGLVADTFGVCRRGYIRKNFIADIAIVDASRVRPNASYESPTEFSEGVEYLIVNGDMVIANNNYDGRLPGQVLRLTDCDD